MTGIHVMLVSLERSSHAMDDRDKRRVGEQIEPGGRPKAPGRLETLQRFVNTYNKDFPPAWDRIGTPAKARAWLLRKGLVAPPGRITYDDVARLREFRETLRTLAAANHGGAVRAMPSRRSGARERGSGFRVGFGASGATELEPVGRGADAAVATVMAILHEAQITGVWPRLKTCRQCGYAFFDRSKNRSAAWCAMSICGNRTKNRSYRRRQARMHAIRARGADRRKVPAFDWSAGATPTRSCRAVCS
jgi:predicted RNA-binding Zn ribbon-like protein